MEDPEADAVATDLPESPPEVDEPLSDDDFDPSEEELEEPSEEPVDAELFFLRSEAESVR